MIDNNIILYNNSGNVLYKFKLPYFKFINSVNKILPYLDEKQCIYIKRELERLKCRLEDNSLYLGTVGSFSSGKSTFLNSILHKNLLPTDAIQGTTVTTSILKRADIDDLDIVYIDGSRKIFSQNKCDLIKEYFGGSEELSYDNDFELQVELFKKLISVEEIGKKVDYVTFYYKNEHMPNGIALVDTPGTESLNSRHNEVTKNAIDNICDAIVVVIPQEKPVSEDLIDYINTNLEKQKQELIFAVTKVELLGDKDELPMLMKNIKKRLEKGIDIEVKNVIPMPTFVYLKEVDNEMKVNIKAINGMPEDERIEMMKLYEDGIEKIKNILENNRVRYINKRAMNISDNIVSSINNMVSLRIKKEEEEKRKYKKSIMSVEKFQKLVIERLEQFRRDMKKRLSDEIQNINVMMNKIKTDIRKEVENCKDVDSLGFDSILSNAKFKNGYQTAADLVEEIEFEYDDVFECIIKEFVNEYKCCGMEEANIIHRFDADWKISEIKMKEVEKEYTKIEEEAQSALDLFVKNKSNGLKVVGLIAGYMLNKSGTIKKIFKEVEPIILNTIDSAFYVSRDYLTTEISAIIDRNTDIGKENILYLLKYNKSDIEKYTEKREQIRNNTNSDTRMMEKAMVSINKYNNIIKEAN
nr:dynamin family protein [uncultured Lachnoanaerobaculum sp.]